MYNFVTDKVTAWQRLAEILTRVETRGLQSLSPKELDELGHLYRLASSHLARARVQGERAEVVEYLNRLVARAHGQIYRVRPTTGQRVMNFFLAEFPRTFRRMWLFAAAAAGLFVLAAVGAHVAVTLDEESANLLLPPSLIERSRADFESGRVEWWAPEGLGPWMSSQIMTRNIQVAFFAFAGGITACLGTVWVLIANGMMLGALAAFYTRHGFGLEFWSLIAPHGVLELTAIFVCGGAGLRLGWALIDPGDYTRRDALVLAGREAVRLVIGAIPMFAIAGLIEGFITPVRMSPAAKLLFACLTGVLLMLYLLRASLERDSESRGSR